MNESSKDRLRKILSGCEPAPLPASSSGAAKPPRPADGETLGASPLAFPKSQPRYEAPLPLPPLDPSAAPLSANSASLPATLSEARLRLQDLRGKMARLSDDFAVGKINRTQFEAIYKHYQDQLQQIEQALYRLPGSTEWRGAVSQGMTGQLRERHAAQVLSYAIYDNTTSLPLATVGSFNVDTSLLVPMLSSFRSATAEMFGAALRSPELEGGRWLRFVPSLHTTLIVLFSSEPARLQLSLIEDLHHDFEVAYSPAFEHGDAQQAAEAFTHLWALDGLATM